MFRLFTLPSKVSGHSTDKYPPKTSGTEYDPTGGDFLSGRALYLADETGHIPLQPSKATHRM